MKPFITRLVKDYNLKVPQMLQKIIFTMTLVKELTWKNT